ncbi:TPA: hypothetical protein RQN23_000808 [Aeromonas veronii]|nr:hypothetical protein [Aeromonas veronii]
MILHPVLHTLPEQQQIELLTHYANNIIGEVKQIPNKVFKSIRVSHNALISHKLEDHMLSSDRVIDCYLDIVEKGIQHCVNHKEVAMDSMPSLGMPQYEGWYEKDLATIAACPRLSHEHIKRIRCLLGYLVDLVPIEATSAAMYGGCFSALAVNPMVDANSLKPQLEILINRIQRQQAYFQSQDAKCYLAAQVLKRVVSNILSKRSSNTEIISLLEHMGRQGKAYLTRFSKPASAVFDIFDFMENAGHKINTACNFDNVVTNERVAYAMKTFTLYSGSEEIVEAIEKNDIANASGNDASHDFIILLQLINATAIRLKQIEAGAIHGGPGIYEYRELMRRSGRFFINLMASSSIEKNKIQDAAHDMLKTMSISKNSDAGLGLYSLIGLVNWIKEHGFIDSLFIAEAIKNSKFNEGYYSLLQENPLISISDMECMVLDIYSKFIGGVKSQNIHEMEALTQRRQFLFATLPMLLTAKYYPALLADEPMDVNGVARAFEMGIYFSLFDEVDIKLMARAGINDIYKTIKPDIMEKIEKNAATHELVTGLLLQERLEQAESSPTLVNRKRPSF